MYSRKFSRISANETNNRDRDGDFVMMNSCFIFSVVLDFISGI